MSFYRSTFTRLVVSLTVFLLLPELRGPGLGAQPTRRHAERAATIEGRIAVPPGFERIELAEGSFAAWLRRLPLRPGRPAVRLYDGRLKGNQDAHYAVVDLDVGERDLQQCADAVMRLRAEYLLAADCGDAIGFRFTSGDLARWSDWSAGRRPVVRGNSVSWRDTGRRDGSYESFRRYLDIVFTYAGTASLERELERVDDTSRVEPGDVFIEGGFPGHAVVVVDVAENAGGQRLFLLAQSFMPAQEIHVLRGPDGEREPWYEARAEGPLRTPEWPFRFADLRRFPRSSCRR